MRLAVILTSRLEDMLHVLDEPTVGLHPADVARLLPVLRRLAGPVVYVEHDRLAAAAADQAIDLGPGAGAAGGQVLFSGSPAELWRTDTASGRFFSLRERVALPGERGSGGRPPDDRDAFLWLRGAHVHNLREVDVPLPLARLTVITGVSGSGKSTLVEDVLVASLLDGKPVGCRATRSGGPRLEVAGKPARLRAVLVDQSPIGAEPAFQPGDLHRAGRRHPRALCRGQRALGLALLLQPARGRLRRPAVAWARWRCRCATCPRPGCRARPAADGASRMRCWQRR